MKKPYIVIAIAILVSVLALAQINKNKTTKPANGSQAQTTPEKGSQPETPQVEVEPVKKIERIDFGDYAS